ncbi:unnamed protein product [Albugo candida]|uniref:Uncharacterized protein n=1 Tax=Albugo candida TaxID=65357 RepID=A0A024GLQ5_9STRA|nr:unnamed protein product [Albugo candida]|eukprot:CCI47815.1 unnamed protein product [Albugo candida]
MTESVETEVATALIIDGAYAEINGQKKGGLNYLKLRGFLEEKSKAQIKERWYFTHERRQYTTSFFTMIKSAPPHGPQFQLKVYGTKTYACRCKRCHFRFNQFVQKGVDNGIATKLLSLAYENICDRFILLAGLLDLLTRQKLFDDTWVQGDGDFYDSLCHVKNVLRKEIWVVGFRDSVSADLQQLASMIIWLDDHLQCLQRDDDIAMNVPLSTQEPSTRTWNSRRHINDSRDSYRREIKKHHREDHRVGTRAKRERRYNGACNRDPKNYELNRYSESVKIENNKSFRQDSVTLTMSDMSGSDGDNTEAATTRSAIINLASDSEG